MLYLPRRLAVLHAVKRFALLLLAYLVLYSATLKLAVTHFNQI